MSDERRETRMKALQSDIDEKKRKLAEIERKRKALMEKKRPTPSSPISPSQMSEPASPTPLSQQVQAIAQKVAKEEEKPPARVVELTRTSVRVLLDTPPCLAEKYSKESQTDFPAAQRPNTLQPPLEDDEVAASPAGSPRHSLSALGTPSLQPPNESFSSVDVPPDQPAVAALTPAEKKDITSRPGFLEFMNRTSLIMERALNVNFDVILETKEDEAVSVERVGERLRLKEAFFDEKWSKNKAVTGISFNPKNPEFCLASYYSRQDGHHSNKYSSSCVLVWSLHLPQRAAYHYHCQGDIANAFYCKHRRDIIIGSTYSGQVVLWDQRQGPEPVMRTPLSYDAHTHPVFGMCVVGTPNSHSLVSLSTDGRFCVWNMDNLSQPLECVDLFQLVDVGDSRVKKDITACTLSFAEQEVNKFFVGSEYGGLYSGNRHGSSSHITEKYEGHVGPITSTHCHPNTGGPVDFSDLIITSSMDWTCKLWTQRRDRCIHSFDEYQEYVYDAAWSPTHPAAFASVDGRGELWLWDLSVTMEIPQAKLDIAGGRALNKVAWSCDGRSLAAGDIKGNLHFCELAPEVASPAPDTWQRFSAKIHELSAP